MSVTLHTSLGDLKVELHCDVCPLACENFLALCGTNYYDNTIFHRNIKGFIIQGGDPTGTGKSGNSIWGRKFKDEFASHLKCDARGTLCMASSGPDTNGSQFFFTYGRHTNLNNVYTIFGKVIDGLQVLDSMERAPVDGNDRPLTNIVLKNVTIHANPLAS